MSDDEIEIPRMGKMSPETINRIGAMATSFITNKKLTGDSFHRQWADVNEIKEVLGDENMELLRSIVEYAMIDSFQRFRFLNRFDTEAKMNDVIIKKAEQKANRIENQKRRVERFAKQEELRRLRDPSGTIPVWMVKK